MKYKTVSPGITRFDVEGSTVRGYMVRICRNGKRISEFFSDARCGGKRKAFQAAQESYQYLLGVMGPIVSPTRNKITRRNTSGKVGVHAAHSTDSRYPNSDTWSYCASWVTNDRKRMKVSFSWIKYGEDVAWELACLAREKLINERERVVTLYENRERRKAAKLKAAKQSTGTVTSKKKTVATEAKLKQPVVTKKSVVRKAVSAQSAQTQRTQTKSKSSAIAASAAKRSKAK